MVLDVNHLSPAALRAACRQFDALGYVQLSGLDHRVTPAFETELADAIGTSRADFQRLLDPWAGAEIFDRDTRQRLSKIATTPRLSESLLSALGPLIQALIGPLVHVSSTYHGQFKGGPLPESAKDIVHYHNEAAADYMEVHGAYRMHQDFTGASIPTSPSGLTLWVALNDCSEATLRVFPGSHRVGLYCHKMWRSDDPRLDQFVPPVEIEARAGTGVIFNALLFHGTGKLGAKRRVSCDVRFFPLTGFLPSDVHWLDAHPMAAIERLRDEAAGQTLLAPLLEQLAFLGADVRVPHVYPLSQMHWVNYLVELVAGNPDNALPHLAAFINTDWLEDPPTVFTQKFHNRTIHRDRMAVVRDRVGGR
jgi:hypothetical protein